MNAITRIIDLFGFLFLLAGVYLAVQFAEAVARYWGVA